MISVVHSICNGIDPVQHERGKETGRSRKCEDNMQEASEHIQVTRTCHNL